MESYGNKIKTGLILEGGALRGLFSAGVMDVMLENGIQFDGMIGVSAGAAFGCNFKSKQAGRVIRYNKRFAHDWRFFSLRSLIVTGNLFGAEFCYHTMPDELDIFDVETYDANPMEFWTVSTDVETGTPFYHRSMKAGYECYEWIRSSASMPIVSKLVEVGGHKFLDGGVSDSIPLVFFQQKGFARNVIVLTHPIGYVKNQIPMFTFIKRLLRKYPLFAQAMQDRPRMYNEQLAYVREQEEAGKVLVIRPKTELPVSHLTHNRRKMQSVYDAGREVAWEGLSRLRRFLAK